MSWMEFNAAELGEDVGSTVQEIVAERDEVIRGLREKVELLDKELCFAKARIDQLVPPPGEVYDREAM